MAVLLYVAFLVGVSYGAAADARDHGLRSGAPSLYLLLAAVPPGPVDGPETALVVARVALAVAALALAAPLFVERLRLLRFPLPFFAFSAALLLTAITSPDVTVSARESLRTIVIIAAFGFLASAIPQERVRRALGHAVAIALAVTLLGAISIAGAFEELRGAFFEKALWSPALGLGQARTAFLGLAGFVTALQLFRTQVKSAALFFVSSSIVLLLPQKRAFWLAAAATFVAWVWFEHLDRFRWVFAAALGFVALFFGAGPVRDLWDREAGREAPGVDNLLSIRGNIFSEAIERFEQDPILGTGLGVGNTDLPIDVGQPGILWHTHTELATILTAAGLVGAVTLAWVYLDLVRGSWRRWTSTQDSLPMLLVIGTAMLLPFHKVLTTPSVLSIGVLAVVAPLALRWEPQKERSTVDADAIA